MRLLGWVVALASFLAWADDSPLRPDSEPRYAPRVGLTAGVHLGTTHWAHERPLLGLRGGVRLRVLEHLALSAQLGWENSVFISFFTPGLSAPRPGERFDVHELSALLGVEVFSTSAFERLLAPELSVTILGGLGAATVVPNDPVEPWVFRGLLGVRLQMLRLWPSRWWFPVYVQLMTAVTPYDFGVTSIAAGIGI